MYFLSIILLLLIAAVWLYLHVTRHFNYWKNLNIPYIKPTPFFGNLFKVVSLKCSIHEMLLDLHNSSNAGYTGFFVFDRPALLIRDRTLVKSVLIKDFDHFDDRNLAVNKDDKISSNILFVVPNPTWRAIRTKIAPVFASGKMKRMFPLVVEACEELTTYMENVEVHAASTKAREMCLRYTTDVISSCAFGINAFSFRSKDAPFWIAAERFFDWTSLKRSLSMSAYFVAPILVKLLKLSFIEPVSGNFCKTIFLKHMKEREESKTPRGDLIDLLIELRKTNDNKDLDDDVIVAQAVQFFFAGFETAGTTLVFALYSLAKNPEIQTQLRLEIRSVLKKHGELTYDTCKLMPFLDQVVNETLRIYPILPYLDRRCTKPYAIPNSDVVLPVGVPVYISVSGFHFDPDIYPDPYAFKPDRFSEEKKADGGMYLPFGDGPHNCIGSRFAIMTIKVALIRLIYKFEVETSSKTHDPLQYDSRGFLLAPIGGELELHFKKHIP